MDLPAYRVVPAPILMEAVDAFKQVRGQRVGVSEFPDFAQDDLEEVVRLVRGSERLRALPPTRPTRLSTFRFRWRANSHASWRRKRGDTSTSMASTGA